jgi:hypothetical protein
MNTSFEIVEKSTLLKKIAPLRGPDKGIDDRAH